MFVVEKHSYTAENYIPFTDDAHTDGAHTSRHEKNTDHETQVTMQPS